MLTTKDFNGGNPPKIEENTSGEIGDYEGREVHAAVMEHSPLGPSSSDRWLVCTASVLFTKDMEEVSSTYANEGTAAHKLSEWCRERNIPAKNFRGHQIDVENSDGSIESFIVDKEMVDGVQVFLDYVDQFDSEVDLFEERINYTAWVENGFGTSDDTRISEDGAVRVTDLKYGKGKQVYAEKNTQLMLYALGVFQDYGHLYDMSKFILTVCQPRLDHVDEWEISLEDLLTWADEVAQPQSIEALHGDAVFVEGKHCQFCRGKSRCAHRAEAIAKLDFDPLEETGTKDIKELSNDQIADLLERKPNALAFWKDLEEKALSEIQAGYPVGDFKLVEGRSSRKWRNEAEAEKAMRANLQKLKLKVADIFTKKLITAPQAEKVFGKGHAVMKEQIIKPQGKPVLVPGSDKREPYAPKAEDEFDKID